MAPLDMIRFVRDFPPGFIGSNGKLVLFAMVSRSGKAGMCFPSYRKLAQDTGLSASTIKRTLKVLEDTGLIIRQRRFKRSNIYRITFAEWVSANPGALSAMRDQDKVLLS